MKLARLEDDMVMRYDDEIQVIIFDILMFEKRYIFLKNSRLFSFIVKVKYYHNSYVNTISELWIFLSTNIRDNYVYFFNEILKIIFLK